MDIYGYSEDDLSVIAGNCRHMKIRRAYGPSASAFSNSAGVSNSRATNTTGAARVSCALCSNWNGSGCARNEFDNIASNLRIDSD